MTEPIVYHSLYHIDKISLPHSSELEEDISVKHYFISDYLDISIIPVSLFRYSSFFILHYSLIAISELSESLPDSRIKIPIRLTCHLECEYEHILRTSIKYSSTRYIEFMEPVSLYKTGKLRLEFAKSCLYLREESRTILYCVYHNPEMRTDDIITPFLHICILVKIRKRPSKFGLFLKEL